MSIIVVSIPADLDIKDIDFKGNEWIEYRLDMQEKAGDTELLNLDDRSILTWRTDSSDILAYQNKINLFHESVKQFDCMVDVELENYDDFEDLSDNIILSVHYEDFDEEKIIETLNLFKKKISKYYKLVVKADTYKQIIRLRELTRNFPYPVFVLSTGKLSYFSRLMNWYINSIGTYVGLEGHLTAENQISREFFYMTKGHIINDKTLIGGLLGGSQIYKSIGLRYYNSWLGGIEKNAAYIPLFAEDIEDFIYFVMNSHIRFFGYSITMPFKYMPGRRYPVNFFCLSHCRYRNTDIIAFKEGFKKLSITENYSVLVVGTGATAESALIALTENNHNMKYVKIYGRNKIRIGQLKFEYKVDAVEPTQKHFDLLINCTPLGFNGEDVKDYIGDITFDKVIDLPYVIKKKTPLVQSIDEKNCFDGIEFWLAQSKSQMVMFSTGIRRIKKILTESS